MDVLRIAAALSSEASLKILDEARKGVTTCAEISMRRDVPPSTCYKKYRELLSLGLLRRVEMKGANGIVCPYSRISVIFENGTVKVVMEGEEKREVLWEVPR